MRFYNSKIILELLSFLRSIFYRNYHTITRFTILKEKDINVTQLLLIL